METTQLAQRIVKYRLQNYGLSQYQPWRSVAEKLDMKESYLRKVRQSDEFFDVAKARTQAKIEAFQKAVGKPPKYQLVYRFIKGAFGLDKSKIRLIIDECLPKT